MKYCPYCGAELVSGAASFCSECGKNLSTDNEQPERREMRKKPERSKRRHMRKESVHTTPKRQEKKMIVRRKKATLSTQTRIRSRMNMTVIMMTSSLLI